MAVFFPPPKDKILLCIPVGWFLPSTTANTGPKWCKHHYVPFSRARIRRSRRARSILPPRRGIGALRQFVTPATSTPQCPSRIRGHGLPTLLPLPSARIHRSRRARPIPPPGRGMGALRQIAFLQHAPWVVKLNILTGAHVRLNHFCSLRRYGRFFYSVGGALSFRQRIIRKAT